MWQFVQSTGEFLQDGVPLGVGYAGGNIFPNHDPSAVNNPARQREHNFGPLPRGSYLIGPAHDEPTLGPCAMYLTPAPTNEMFGRSGFFIHGDSIAHPGQASEGCIVLPPALRQTVAHALDRMLIVTPLLDKPGGQLNDFLRWMRMVGIAGLILFCFASAAWCQLPSEVHTAAASEPSCAERLDDVQHQLIGLRADIKRISQTIDSTNEGLEIKSADALENAALNTSTLQDSQSLNARLAQAAVASAANAAAVQSRDQLVTTVCGFATVLFGLAITYLKGHLTSKKLETVLRASSETE